MCVCWGKKLLNKNSTAQNILEEAAVKKRLKLSGEILAKLQTLNSEGYIRKRILKKGPARRDHSNSHRKGSLYSLLELERRKY